MAKSSSKAERDKVERIIERTMKLFKPEKLGKGGAKKLSKATRQAIDILQSRARQQLH